MPQRALNDIGKKNKETIHDTRKAILLGPDADLFESIKGGFLMGTD